MRAELDSGPALFPPGFYTDPVVGEVVGEVVGRQRTYADNARTVAPKIDRYKRLLARARGEDENTATGHGSAHPPEHVLAPYFAVNSLSGPWWPVMERIWAHCRTLPDPASISPVLCVGPPPGGSLLDAVLLLDACLDRAPAGLSRDVFFWVTGLQERNADARSLTALWNAVAKHTTRGLRLTNLYGGFFSICLGHAGLVAFNNGLAYSESRDWPALDATGAVPARYYIPQMHLFAAPATAEVLLQRQPAFRCDCAVCQRVRASGRSVVSMEYGELKAHFALTRAWEIDLAARNTPAGIATHLRTAHRTYLSTPLPTGVRVDNAHLATWATVLEAV